jgi:hypothetical protein
MMEDGNSRGNLKSKTPEVREYLNCLWAKQLTEWIVAASMAAGIGEEGCPERLRNRRKSSEIADRESRMATLGCRAFGCQQLHAETQFCALLHGYPTPGPSFLMRGNTAHRA